MSRKDKEKDQPTDEGREEVKSPLVELLDNNAKGEESSAPAAETTAPPSPAGGRIDVEDVEQLEVEFIEADVPEEEPTIKYWIGTLDGCPFQNVIVGSQDFPNYTEELEEDASGGGTTNRMKRLGQIRYLTQSQVEEIKALLKRLVLRKLGPRSVILDTAKPSYRRNSNDYPLALYLYMVRVKDRMPTNWREAQPPSMAKPKA